VRFLAPGESRVGWGAGVVESMAGSPLAAGGSWPEGAESRPPEGGQDTKGRVGERALVHSQSARSEVTEVWEPQEVQPGQGRGPAPGSGQPPVPAQTAGGREGRLE